MPVAQHPLAPPTLSGNVLSVDLMLQQPTRVTRLIQDMTLQRFIADRAFQSAGGVTGGAVVYDVATLNDLYPDREVEPVEPGSEFPIVTSSRPSPSIAYVEKWGGKTYITDEARDRNDAILFTNEVRKIGNTIVRKMNTLAIAKLDATFITYSSQTWAGHSWSAVVPVYNGVTVTAPSAWPHADLAKAQLLAAQQELGITLDLVLINPADLVSLINIYGNLGKVDDVFAALGLTYFQSNRVTAGTVYVLASGQVGQMRLEKPLGTETWREQETERTWVQASVRPLMFVNNPYAVQKITGIA